MKLPGGNNLIWNHWEYPAPGVFPYPFKNVRYPRGWAIRSRMFNPGICPYCGVRMTREECKAGKLLCTDRDHIVPRSKGGDNEFDNLVLCCRKCNGEKMDMSLLEFMVARMNRTNGKLYSTVAIAKYKKRMETMVVTV